MRGRECQAPSLSPSRMVVDNGLDLKFGLGCQYKQINLCMTILQDLKLDARELQNADPLLFFAEAYSASQT